MAPQWRQGQLLWGLLASFGTNRKWTRSRRVKLACAGRTASPSPQLLVSPASTWSNNGQNKQLIGRFPQVIGDFRIVN